MKTTNPKDYIELLKVFSAGLMNGILNKNEVIQWADSIITQDEEPDDFVIELSLCGHKSLNEMVAVLNEFIGQVKPQISGRVVLGCLYRQYLSGKITLRKVVETVDWMVWQTNLSDEEKSFMYGLEDDYHCAEEGIYGTLEEVEKKTLRFLEIYKDFQIDHFNEWALIDAGIDDKIKVLSAIVDKENEDLLKNQRAMTKRKWWKWW